jgi:hydrogenase expression/formation protein HypE
MTSPEGFQLQCPVPFGGGERIQMAHGGGGTLMNDLIERVFRSAFSSNDPSRRHDAALVFLSGRAAFTTDSYVVKPLFFPGGDIGTLAVNGTANDLAMAGAEPKSLSCAFILEEGLPIETLQRVVESMRQAAVSCGVEIVTGDTKVVDAGKGDQLFVTTAGIGAVSHHLDIGPHSVRAGDAVIVSGDLGRHGVAILAVREGLAFETEVVSDCAPLWPAVKALLDAGVEIHCLRDLTRGGLVSTVNEIARDSKTRTVLEEKDVPVSGPVASACEILGLDPLSVANEGRFALYVPENQVEKSLQALRSIPVSSGAARIGRVENLSQGELPRVLVHTALGSERLLDMLSGEQLPRIC